MLNVLIIVRYMAPASRVLGKSSQTRVRAALDASKDVHAVKSQDDTDGAIGLGSFEELLPDLPPSFPRKRESIESDWLFDAGKDIEREYASSGSPRSRGRRP